jgi:hypothetical protein
MIYPLGCSLKVRVSNLGTDVCLCRIVQLLDSYLSSYPLGILTFFLGGKVTEALCSPRTSIHLPRLKNDIVIGGMFYL